MGNKLGKILYTGNIHRNWLKNFPGNVLIRNYKDIELVIGSSKLILEFNIEKENYELILPIAEIKKSDEYVYDFTVDWGDKNTVHYTSFEDVAHKFESKGTYKVSIAGDFFGFNNKNNYLSETTNPWKYLTRIITWGCCDIWFLNYRICRCK
jgi:hypothetical protein